MERTIVLVIAHTGCNTVRGLRGKALVAGRDIVVAKTDTHYILNTAHFRDVIKGPEMLGVTISAH